MSADAAYPSKIQRLSPEKLRVTWSDGHHAEYSAVHLRKKCPCAGCSQEVPKKPGLLPVIPPNMPDRMEVTQVAAMGNYAIGFHFNDGHTTGIYSFEYLRGICPCPVCAAPKDPP